MQPAKTHSLTRHTGEYIPIRYWIMPTYRGAYGKAFIKATPIDNHFLTNVASNTSDDCTSVPVDHDCL